MQVLDPRQGEVVLSHDGRRVTTLESLSELTTAVAFKRCHYKSHTRRVLQDAGLRVPRGRLASFDDGDAAFLEECKEIVVKPDRGEGGQGLTVGVTDRQGLETALAAARAVCPDVLLEQRVDGEDVRVIVIGDDAVAAAVRCPPIITGDGERTVAELVESLSRSRAEATGGAARVPLDDKTLEVVRVEGYEPDSVLPEGVSLDVRRTANVHTGGTIEDVTPQLHSELVAVSIAAATAINIPVVGIDLMVPAVDGPEYTIIEANERPGLANHEPQPTAQRFVDLLFPETAST